MGKVGKYTVENRVRATDFIVGHDENGNVKRFRGNFFLRSLANDSAYLAMLDDEVEARIARDALLDDKITAILGENGQIQGLATQFNKELYGPGGIKESYTSAITQTAEAITLSVENMLYGPEGIEAAYTSMINQTATAITMSVDEKLYGPDGIQQKYTSAIQQYSDQILLTVNGTLNDFENEVYTEVGSIIQQSATDILLQLDGKIVDVKSEITTEYTSAITVAKDEIALTVSGQMSTLEGDITEAYQSAISVAKGEIALTVNGQLTDLEDGITQAYESAIVVAKGEINMSVAGQLTTLEGDITAAYESAIDISEGQILSTVGTQITDLDGRIASNTSSITQLSNSIDLSVFTDGKLNAGILIESVNDYEGAIKIAADKIQIDGSTTFADGYNPYAIQAELEQYKTDNDAAVDAIAGNVGQLSTDLSGMSVDIEAIEEFNDGLLDRINGLAVRKNARYISPTEPVLPEGEEFSIGDEWLQEIEVPSEDGTGIELEYKSMMWFGDDGWQPNETKINGARIETGTIDAASIITETLFSKKIGGVELDIVSGSIGGFTIDDRLVAENDAGQGLIIDPSSRSILLNDMVEGYGVSRIAMTAKGLTAEATINNGGGLGFSATIDSAEYNIRMPGDVLVNSNNTRAGVSFVQYIGKAASNQAQIRSAVPTQSSGFPVDLNTSYTFDLPYSFRIYHDGGDRNGKKNKLHGSLQVSVTATLIGLNSSGVSKALIDPISVQTLITRSTNDTEVFMRPITFKTSFYSDNSVAVYWRLDIDLDGDLAYQQWTSQLFGHYWMTSESRGIDYRGCVPKGLSMDASVGLLELTTSGLQFAWSQDRFFRIDGPNEDYFIKSTGKWVHDGTFQLNGSDIVTVDNVSSAIASDLSAYAMKSYVNDGFYNKTQADNLFALKENHFDKTTSDGRFAKKAGDRAQDFNVKDLIIHGQVNHWLAQQLVVDDARIQVNRKQGGVTVDSGLVIYNKDTSAEASSLVYDVNGIWRAGGDRLFTEAYNPKLGGYSASSYPRKAEDATITGAWTFRTDENNLVNIISGVGPSAVERISGIKLGRISTQNNNHWEVYARSDKAWGNNPDFHIEFQGDAQRFRALKISGQSGTQGFVGLGLTGYPTERLHVAGNGLFTGNLSAPTFVSGFAGSGWRLEAGAENHLTVDRLTVRGRMDVYELAVNQIRGTNGAQWVSDSAKVESVSGNRLFIDTGGDTSFVPFAVNDLLRCQRWNGKNIKYYVVRVTAVGSNYIDVVLVDGSSPREAGDYLVRMGNTVNTNRQGALYLTSSDNNAPYMDVLDGVNSASFAGKTKVRIGRLDGITDPDLGTLSGYGLYTENGYFKGKIQVTGGNAATKADVDAIQVGGRNLLKNTTSGVGWSKTDFDAETRTFTRATTQTSESFVVLINQTALKNNTTYTLSAWIRSNGQVKDVDFYVYNKGVTKTHSKRGIAVTTDWQFVTLTFTTDSSTDYSESTIRFDNNGSKTAGVNAILYVKEPKLERGNKATDWTPAPEDVPSALDYLATAIQDGSTDIEGGLINTNVLMVKDTNGKVRGGISGLASDNIGFWTGGTYQDAINNNANVIFRKDGSISLAGGKIIGTSDGSLFVDAGVITGTIESSNYDGTKGSQFDLYNGHLLIGDAIRISGDTSEIQVRNRETGLDSFKVGDFPLTPINFIGTGVDVALSSSSVTAMPASGSYQLNRTVYVSSTGYITTGESAVSNSLIPGGIYSFQTKLKITLSYLYNMYTVFGYSLDERFRHRGGNGIKMQLKNGNTVVWEKNIIDIPANGVIPLSITTSFQAVSTSLRFIITIDGEYEYRVPDGANTKYYNTSASISRFDSSSRLVLKALVNRMEFSTKGMQAVFSTTNYFRCDDMGVIARGDHIFTSTDGRYMLRISNNGIQKSTDYGNNWTTL